jgi:hypothetical protein
MLAVYKWHIMFTFHTHFTDMPDLPRTATCTLGPFAPLLFCGVAGMLACSASESRPGDNRAELMGLDSAAFEAKFAQPVVSLPLSDSARLSSTGSAAIVSAQGRASAAGAEGTGNAAEPAARGGKTAGPGAAKVNLTNVTSARSDSIARAMVARMASAAGNAASRSDSVSGIVTLTGTAPAVTVGLRSPAGGGAIQLSGMATSSLARLGGATVTARGMRITARDFVVAEFFVRAVNGTAVIDGVLESSAGASWLRPTDGSPRVRLTDLPASLRGREGSRVWIATETKANTPRQAGLIGRR